MLSYIGATFVGAGVAMFLVKYAAGEILEDHPRSEMPQRLTWLRDDARNVGLLMLILGMLFRFIALWIGT